MSAVSVPAWTIQCDFCRFDASSDSDYSGFGPGPSEARQEFCDDWAEWRDLDICTECYITVTCQSCGEEDMGWAGNCVECWEKVE